MKKSLHIFAFALIVSLSALPAAAEEAQSPATGPVAEAVLSPQGLVFIPHIGYESLELRVLLPDGELIQKIFKSGESPEYRLPAGVPDGACTWELRVTPPGITRRSRDKAAPGSEKIRPILQSGHFRVSRGLVAVPDSGKPELSSPQDIVHADDVIIDGSLCVGNDCYSGLAFGFDTIVMMENNLRIFFDDTSSIQNYPRNDWRIILNDSTDGGGNYFAIEDATEVSNIFVLEAGAPDNSLYVDNYGDVGIGTSTPYYELHIVDGDSPCLRLDQDGSYGWTPQKWDICGNESNFFIRDATHASKLPFRIEPDAPTDSIFVKSNGMVGFGTGSPGFTLHARTTGENAIFSLERTDGAQFKLSCVTNKVQIGAQSNHDVRFTTNNVARMVITNTGNVGINELSPTHQLQLGGGAYCDGGAWVAGSSRALKTNIQNLGVDEAQAAVMHLKPVKFRYKADTAEEYLGFIAEDVPDLVAMKDRKGMTAMDVVAALTKVVQEQQQTIRELKSSLEKQKAEFSVRLEKLENR